MNKGKLWAALLLAYFIITLFSGFAIPRLYPLISFWSSWIIVSLSVTAILAITMPFFLVPETTQQELQRFNLSARLANRASRISLVFGVMFGVYMIIMLKGLYEDYRFHLGYAVFMYFLFMVFDDFICNNFNEKKAKFDASFYYVDLPSLVGFAALFLICLVTDTSLQQTIMLKPFIAGAVVFEIFGAHTTFAIINAKIP